MRVGPAVQGLSLGRDAHLLHLLEGSRPLLSHPLPAWSQRAHPLPIATLHLAQLCILLRLLLLYARVAKLRHLRIVRLIWEALQLRGGLLRRSRMLLHLRRVLLLRRLRAMRLLRCRRCGTPAATLERNCERFRNCGVQQLRAQRRQVTEHRQLTVEIVESQQVGLLRFATPTRKVRRNARHHIMQSCDTVTYPVYHPCLRVVPCSSFEYIVDGIHGSVNEGPEGRFPFKCSSKPSGACTAAELWAAFHGLLCLFLRRGNVKGIQL